MQAGGLSSSFGLLSSAFSTSLLLPAFISYPLERLSIFYVSPVSDSIVSSSEFFKEY